MSDAVTIAIITVVGGIACALIGQMHFLRRDVNRVGLKTERVREQVENSHGTNFRMDLDKVARDVSDTKRLVTDLTLRVDGVAQHTSERLRAVESRLDRHIDSEV